MEKERPFRRALAVGGLFLGGCSLAFFVGRGTAPEPSFRESAWSERGPDRVRQSPFQSQASRAVEFGQEPHAEPLPAFDERRFFAVQLEARREAIRDRAQRDPAAALVWAEQGRSPRERKALREAALEGWARSDPAGALRAAMELPKGAWEDGLRAALRGAAIDEIKGRAAFERAFADAGVPPEIAREARLFFAAQLGSFGHFEAALSLAEEAKGDRDRAALLDVGFGQWARYEPEDAVVATLDLVDQRERSRAWSVAIAAWAETEPSSLAEFAEALPDGEERLRARVALAFCALSLPAPAAALKAASRNLAYELDRQILADGGHVSRNPRAIMELLADLLPLRQTYTNQAEQPPQALIDAVERMLPALRFFRHREIFHQSAGRFAIEQRTREQIAGIGFFLHGGGKRTDAGKRGAEHRFFIAAGESSLLHGRGSGTAGIDAALLVSIEEMTVAENGNACRFTRSGKLAFHEMRVIADFGHAGRIALAALETAHLRHGAACFLAEKTHTRPGRGAGHALSFRGGRFFFKARCRRQRFAQLGIETARGRGRKGLRHARTCLRLAAEQIGHE